MFMRNLLLNEKHELHNREMHIRGKFLLGHDNPINDPIKLDERELQIVELLREESGFNTNFVNYILVRRFILKLEHGIQELLNVMRRLVLASMEN